MAVHNWFGSTSLSSVELFGNTILLTGIMINCKPIKPRDILATNSLLRVSATTPRVRDIKRIIMLTRRLSTLFEEMLETIDKTGPYPRLIISAKINEKIEKFLLSSYFLLNQAENE
jgi:hypothetical protein